MIALIASALLGLYVFVPYILFHRLSSLFIRLKKFQRTKTDEIVFGVMVAVLPFVVTLLLFGHGWWIAGRLVPFPLVDSHQQKVTDYRTVFAAADSDNYFKEHQTEAWDAIDRVCERQADFLAWNYLFLFVETGFFILMTSAYGRLRHFGPYAWFASRMLIPALSEWHVLLTDFNFPPRERRSVEIDAMTKGNILYRGNVADYFLGTSGELSGLLLKAAQRFQYDKLVDDRKAGKARESSDYWKPIAGGGNFYLPNDNIASLNIRYQLPTTEFEKIVREAVNGLALQGVSNVKVEVVRGCRCVNTKHGHQGPCNAPATENDQMCKACQTEAAKEFGGIPHTGTPQDSPPMRHE
jgi:hypothetical protein